MPALAEHERIDLALQQMGRRLGQSFLEAGRLIHEAIERKAYEHYGFTDGISYAESRLNVSYRSLARWLACWQAVLRAPEPEREDVKATFAEIGSHKAGVLAPAVGDERTDWRELGKFAKEATEEALQYQVSESLGTKRGGDTPPGQSFYRYLLAHTPPDCEEEVKEVFELGFKLCASRNPIAVFLGLCREILPEWRDRVNRGVE